MGVNQPPRSGAAEQGSVLTRQTFPQGTSDATASAYFLYGIEVGLLPWDSAKDWALNVIGERDQPSIEIIDIATACQRLTAIESLGALAVDADLPLAGRLLLATLHDQLETGGASLRSALDIALQIASLTRPWSEAYYDFDLLDDKLNLAEDGVYGTVSEVLADTLSVLSPSAMEHSEKT